MGIFMDRPTLPSADPSTVWLADLIEATEVVAASAEPCDPAIVKAFSHRLGSRKRSHDEETAGTLVFRMHLKSTTPPERNMIAPAASVKYWALKFPSKRNNHD